MLVAASAVPAVSTSTFARAAATEPGPAISSPTNPAGSWTGSGGTAATFVFGPDGGYGSAGRWLFNEGNGGSVRDSSGNGRTVGLAGDATWVAGRGGYTLRVAGNGYGTTASSVVPTNASFTVTAWAKPSAVPTYSTVVSQDGGAGLPAFDLGTRDGRWRFDRRPSRETYMYPIGINGPVVQTGVWTHLMGVYDHANSKLIFYVNWAYVGEVAFSNANGWLATGGLNIGRSGGWNTDFFHGEIDDVRVWSGAISVATAQATSTATAYRYWLDGGARTTVGADGGTGGDATVSVLPGSDGPHTLNVVALNAAGAESAQASWQFNSGPGGITSPRTGSPVGNEVTLSGVAHPGTTGVTYQWRRTDADAWATIPAAHVVRASGGAAVTWPLASTGSGAFPALTWKAEQTIGAADGTFQIRGQWTGGVGGASYPNTPVHRYGLVAAVPGCAGGLASGGDFNADGIRDTVIADPMVTLDGVWAAGVVYVVDGATGAYRPLDERLPEVPGDIVSGDRFGWSTAVYDANGDRCADLVVGVPKKDVAGQTDAGLVHVFFGTPAGVGKGPVLTWEQGVNGIPGASNAYDNFGYAVSAGQHAADPFLIIGVPGEDVPGKTDAGKVAYLRAGYKLFFSADDAGGVGSGSELDDRAGEAIASTPHQFAVAFPGEDGTNSGAGAGRVCVFSHTVASSAYATPIGCVDQGGDMETGDSFGKSIAMAPYRKPGTSATTDALLAVGVPGEDGGTGAVHQYHVTGSAVTEIPNARTTGTAVGDLYGEKVYVHNTTTTAAESTDQTLILAVGAPGAFNGPLVDAGSVRVMPATRNNALPYDVRVTRRAGSLPGAAAAHELVGMHLGGTPQLLLVPSPYQGQQAVYGIEWAKLVTGSSDVTKTWAAPPAGGGVAPNRNGDWAFNENTGLVADDSAGSFDMTVSGAGWAAGHSGSGLTFSGANALAQTAGPVLNTSQSFTVEAWVRLSGVGEWENAVTQWADHHMGFTLAYSQPANGWVMAMVDQDGQPDMTYAAATSAPQVGVWTRLTGVYDASAGQLRIYVNGTLEGTVAHTAAWSAGGPLTVGNGRWWGELASPWQGDIDEVRVWQRALTAAEIAQGPAGPVAEAFGAQVG
jgi:hypothetical protein